MDTGWEGNGRYRYEHCSMEVASEHMGCGEGKMESKESSGQRSLWLNAAADLAAPSAAVLYSQPKKPWVRCTSKRISGLGELPWHTASLISPQRGCEGSEFALRPENGRVPAGTLVRLSNEAYAGM